MPVVAKLKAFALSNNLVVDEPTHPREMGEVSLYSPDMFYRYAYACYWRRSPRFILWVMLNPGTGDTEARGRPTLSRCISWAKDWGYGGLLIGNAFAARARSAQELKRKTDRVGPVNDSALKLLAACSRETMVAWGRNGALEDRDLQLLSLLPAAYCFELTRNGQPHHPIGLPQSSDRYLWAGRGD